MFSSITNLVNLRKLGVQGVPSKAPSIIQVTWHLPLPGWIKINVDGAANGCPSLICCGRIFIKGVSLFRWGLLML